MKLTGSFIIKEIKKKTSAEFFKGLKAGDQFDLVYEFQGRYKQAPVIDIYQDGKEVHSNNSLQLKTNLESFDLEQTN